MMSLNKKGIPEPNTTDVASNRRATKYSAAELLSRILWAIALPAFCYSPRICFGWRRVLLRLFGASVGRRVNIYPSCRIYYPWKLVVGNDTAIGEDSLIYNLGQVTIGCRVTISHRSHLCAGTHDYTDPAFPLQKPPIKIDDDAWICADAFVGPGVVIGAGAIVGARAAVFNNVDPWTIVGGNPARFLRDRHLNRDESASAV